MNFFESAGVFGAALSPILAVVTLYINRKFDAKQVLRDQQIADLTARLDACEARHKVTDEQRIVASFTAPPAVQSVDSAGKK